MFVSRAITVSYAFKKDTKGERHGTAAERMLAAQNPLFPKDRPHQVDFITWRLKCVYRCSPTLLLAVNLTMYRLQ